MTHLRLTDGATSERWPKNYSVLRHICMQRKAQASRHGHQPPTPAPSFTGTQAPADDAMTSNGQIILYRWIDRYSASAFDAFPSLGGFARLQVSEQVRMDFTLALLLPLN